MERAPLSFGQEALWLFQQMSPRSCANNLPLAYRMAGALDVGVLRAAFDLVVRRHDVLRTAFRFDEDGVFHEVLPAAAVDVPVYDLGSAGPDEPAKLIDDLVRTPFDLAEGKPLRVAVIRLSDNENILVVVVHHIVSDAWSLRLLVDELSTAHRALVRGDDPECDLPHLDIRFSDYIHWQREWLTPALMAAPLAWWERTLADVPTLDLTDGRPRPRRPTYAAGRVIVDVPDDIARAVGPARFAPLAAAFADVLRQRTGRSDIAFGTLLAGRPEPELERLIGYFVNLVVLRCDLADDPPPGVAAARTGAAMLAAIDNEVPFSSLVDRLAPSGMSGRNPIFTVVMQLVTGGSAPGGLDLSGVTATEIDVHPGQHPFDLTITFIDAGSRLRVSTEYSTEVFDADWAANFTGQLVRSLGVHCADGSADDLSS